MTTITMQHIRIDGNRTNAELSAANVSADVGVYSTKNLLIRDCEFLDAPRHHVAIDAASSSIMITGSRFHGAAWSGVWTDTPAVPFLGSSTSCEKPPDLPMMNDMAIADNLQVIGNLFRDNHWEAPFNISGGQVDILNCSDNVAFHANHFVEGRRTANGWWADGLEIYASNVALVDNTVENHAGAAGTFLGTEDLFIAHWNPRTAFRANSGGPFIANSQGYRTVARVHMDRMTSVNGTMNYGVNVDNARTGALIRGVVLTGSCLAGNREPSFLRGLDRDAIVRDNLTANCGAQPGDHPLYTLPSPQIFDRTITVAEPVQASSLRLALTRGGNWAALGSVTPDQRGTAVTVHIDTAGLAGGIYTVRLMNGSQAIESFEVEVGHGGPLFSAGGVLNEASRQPGPLAPGALIHIYGRNFGPPFPYEGLLFDGFMPDSIAEHSDVILQMEDMGALSPPVKFPVAAAAPGIFPEIRSADDSIIGEGRPAKPGDVVGDQDAEILNVSRLGPSNSGIVKVEFRIPATAKGPLANVTLRAGDFETNTIACPCNRSRTL